MIREATYFKRDCYTCLNVVKLLRTPFLIEHLRRLPLVFSFKQNFPSFYIKMTGLLGFCYTSSFTDLFLGSTKPNPKATAWMCSIKKLFLEILQN